MGHVHGPALRCRRTLVALADAETMHSLSPGGRNAHLDRLTCLWLWHLHFDPTDAASRAAAIDAARYSVGPGQN